MRSRTRAVVAVAPAVAAVMVAATAVSAAPAAAATADAQISTYERFDGRVLDWGFTPRRAEVPHGGTVKWTNTSEFGEPHSATLVHASNVPKTLGEIFACFEGLCGQVIERHFPDDAPRTLVNVGRTGLNTQGDSRLFLPGQSVFATVTAPAGSVLHYICAFHPWMQARLVVG